MPEIRYQQRDTSSAISLAEIHIPDDADFGTGSFSTWLVRKSVPSRKVITSIMVYPPEFQIAVTIKPGGEVEATIGKVNPEHQARFHLPPTVSAKIPHELVVTFTEWQIISATLDGEGLPKKSRAAGH